MRKWLKIFSEAFSREISVDLRRIYEKALAEISPQDIETACKECLMESEFMPTIAAIRGKLNRRKALTEGIVAEKDWQSCLTVAGQYNSDTGECSPERWSRKPALSPAGEYAVRCAGGWRGIYDALYDPERLVWLKKEFLTAHANHREAGRLGVTDADANKLLGQIKQISEGSK